MHLYSAEFHGCRIGALGVTYVITQTIASETPMDREAIIDRLYQTFEHIGALEIKELEISRERPTFGKQYRLTGGPKVASIARGDSWADSEEKSCKN